MLTYFTTSKNSVPSGERNRHMLTHVLGILSMLSLVSTITFGSSVSQAAMFHVELRGDQYPDSGDRITSASGFADFDIIEKSGEPAISYSIQLYGLDLDWNQTPGDPDDDVIKLHIHGDWPNESGPMRFGIIDPEHDNDRVMDAVAGTVTGDWDVNDFGPIDPGDVLAELLAGQWYLNVHTNLYSDGEIRGQILSTSIPEPTSGVLLGLMGLLLLRRRRA